MTYSNFKSFQTSGNLFFQISPAITVNPFSTQCLPPDFDLQSSMLVSIIYQKCKVMITSIYIINIISYIEFNILIHLKFYIHSKLYIIKY